MLAFQDIPQKERIIVALDCDAPTALSLADQLAGGPAWLKVGMTLYYQEGPSIVKALKDRGFKVFLDLKLYDIPHQVAGAVRSLAESGADMITLHGMGGAEMLQAASKALSELPEGSRPATLAVTVLTSFSQEQIERIGIERPIPEEVIALAELSKESRIDGVVCSPQEAAMLRAALGEDALIVTPGIRPKGASLDDQNRVSDPAGAFSAGASHLVIGRPITQAEDPRAAFDAIVEGL